MSEAERERLARDLYEAIGWSGCGGSRWEIMSDDYRRRWLDMADQVGPVIAARLASRDARLAAVEALVDGLGCATFSATGLSCHGGETGCFPCRVRAALHPDPSEASTDA